MNHFDQQYQLSAYHRQNLERHAARVRQGLSLRHVVYHASGIGSPRRHILYRLGQRLETIGAGLKSHYGKEIIPTPLTTDKAMDC